MRKSHKAYTLLTINSLCFLTMHSEARAQSTGDALSRQSFVSRAVSLIETNPADFVKNRYRFAYENLIFGGLSCAWMGELQSSTIIGAYDESHLATGLSLQFYPQSASLDSLFIRAEADIAINDVAQIDSSGKAQIGGVNSTLRIAGDLGWRFRISEQLTGSAAYGLKTTLPQLLWTSNQKLGKGWLAKKVNDQDLRVQINLGILL